MSDLEIVARENFSEVTHLLDVARPTMAKAAMAGQFVIVMEPAQGERIPLTIADFDRKRGTITRVIQAVGKTMAPSAGTRPFPPQRPRPAGN